MLDSQRQEVEAKRAAELAQKSSIAQQQVAVALPPGCRMLCVVQHAMSQFGASLKTSRSGLMQVAEQELDSHAAATTCRRELRDGDEL